MFWLCKKAVIAAQLHHCQGVGDTNDILSQKYRYQNNALLFQTNNYISQNSRVDDVSKFFFGTQFF